MSGDGGDGLRLLLARLDPDPERAGEGFERLRRTLTRFFDWRGAAFPDECADETLDRLAAKVAEGAEVIDPAAMAHGIARLVLLEDYRARGRRAGSGAEAGIPDRTADTADAVDARLAHLDDCLEGLDADERALVLGYYAEPAGRRKIEARRRLADQLRLTENALRSRVQRLRDRLEACLARRAGASSRPAARFGLPGHGSVER